MGALGLVEGIRGCLFDLDGVLTRTASVHASAWKEMFDGFLQVRADESGEPYVPFDPDADYGRYVDGMPRVEGTRSFLASRGIVLPEGTFGDPPGAATVHGLSNHKNGLVQRLLKEHGVEVFDGSVRYVRAVREAGLLTAVVSSSANTVEVLETAGIARLRCAHRATRSSSSTLGRIMPTARRRAGHPADPHDGFGAGLRKRCTRCDIKVQERSVVTSPDPSNVCGSVTRITTAATNQTSARLKVTPPRQPIHGCVGDEPWPLEKPVDQVPDRACAPKGERDT